MLSKYLLPIIITILVVVTAGCTDQSNSRLHQHSLIFCSDGAPDNFNPNMGTSFTNFNASSRVLFDRLLATDNETGHIKSSLALRWERADDGLSYRFDLREGVSFHTTDWFKPSRPLNADDVIFSFARQADVSHPFHLAGKVGYNYFRSTGLQDNLIKIERVSDYEVTFHLQQPDESFLYTLSMDFSSILSAEYANYIQQNGIAATQFDNLPVGSGPFKLNKYQDNSFIRYYAHPQYFSGKPAIDHLIYAITPDTATRYARMISGECDVMLNPPKSQYDLLINDKNIKILQKPSLNIGFMAFNISKPPLDNIRLRQAITMAIDKQHLVDKVYGQLGVLNDSLLPPSMVPFHNADLRTPPHNVEAARNILKELKLTSLELELWALPVQRSYNPNGTLMAELIQEDLEKIGIKTTIVSYEWSTHLEKVKAGEHDLALLGWVADNYNPSDFLSALISCSGIDAKTNRTFWCSSILDGLMNEANNSQDMNKKVQRYFEIQAMIAQQLPLLPIASGESILVARKSVKNITIQALGGISFTQVSKGEM